MLAKFDVNSIQVKDGTEKKRYNYDKTWFMHEFNLLKKYNNPNYYDKSKKYYEKLSDEDLDYIFHILV